MAAAHVNLGAVYLAKRDYASAVGPLRRSLELNPKLPGAHGMLGTALLALGYACDSIAHLEQGKSEDLLGVALLECGRPREALDRLESSLEKRPDDPDLLYYLGLAHGQLSKAAIDRLRAVAPDSPRTNQVLGEAQAAMRNRAAAEKHFAAALAARPDLLGAHYALGELYLQAGEFDKARAEFAAEAKSAPGSASAAYKLGYSLAQLGNTSEAIVELKRANALQPGMPETLLELGKILHATGDSKSAEGYLKEVLAAEAESQLAEAAHFQLSQVYRALGRTAEADREAKAFQSLRARRAQRP
jgi:tetratricopeptide (TPR) repeat protein